MKTIEVSRVVKSYDRETCFGQLRLYLSATGRKTLPVLP